MGAMTEFTKMKISFALALLGVLFALHPFLDRFDDRGFVYLGYDLKVFYAYSLTAGLLSVCVYLYAVSLMGDRTHSSLERLGNYTYALAILIVPIYGGLFLSAKLADAVAMSHLAWAAPSVAMGLGVGWLGLTQLVAWRIRGRLGEGDRAAKIEQLAKQEIESLNSARDLFESEHYDLSVIEAWRALEARLRQALLSRKINTRLESPDAVIHAAVRKGIMREPIVGVVNDLRRHWIVAVSTEPLPRESALQSLSAVRHILSIVPVDKPAQGGPSGSNVAASSRSIEPELPNGSIDEPSSPHEPRAQTRR
jgi:HEPN domain-containing protein